MMVVPVPGKQHDIAGCREAFDASAFRHSANSHFCLDLQAFL